jgi:pyruvate dehydrogenase E2 component (dihydrolipoamide acetyltransferase)
MAIPVIMPRQGQSVETCIITEWVKKKGEMVNKGDILFAYETDKASFEAEAETEGLLLEIFYNEGDEVPVLNHVAVIGKSGEAVENYRPGGGHDANLQKQEGGLNSESGSQTSILLGSPDLEHASSGQKIKISPRARMMAKKNGIDILTIQGSGPYGRIIASDIEKASNHQTGMKVPFVPDSTIKRNVYTPPVASSIFSDKDYSINKLSNVRKLIAKAMHESISNSAQLTHHMSADVRKLQALRAKVKSEVEKGGGANITLNDMVCFAVIRALEIYPEVNSHLLGDATKTFKNVHLGLAVDTPRGLMVAAVPNASDLSLKGLAGNLKDVAEQCRKGNINPELLASTAASFTVSNLGNYGVEMFTPIINLPQVAILGVNTITYRPADLGAGVFGFVPVIGLSLTYDHRAIDGGQATLFLREIKNQIENFKSDI